MRVTYFIVKAVFQYMSVGSHLKYLICDTIIFFNSQVRLNDNFLNLKLILETRYVQS